MSVLFINETSIKLKSILTENIDMDLLTPIIIQMQEMHILPIVGTALYNELKDQVENNNLTALNITLLNEYIQPSLVQWVLKEMPVVLAYKMANKNVLRRTGENTQSTDINEIQWLTDKFKGNAEWYSERITKYLLENAESYPLYVEFGTGIDDIKPVKSNYSTNIYLGNVTTKKRTLEERFQGNYDADCF